MRFMKVTFFSLHNWENLIRAVFLKRIFLLNSSSMVPFREISARQVRGDFPKNASMTC